MQSEKEKLKKRAYARASRRLVAAHEFEYEIFLFNITGGQHHPNRFTRRSQREAAQKRLRDHFPDDFYKLHEEEKERLGLPPGRHAGEVAREILRLYDNGNGLTTNEIAARLKVSTTTIAQVFKDAGVVTRTGRRKKT